MTQQLKKYLESDIEISSKTPLLLDSYLGAAIEVDVDLMSDGKDCFVAGIMEHIERSRCSLWGQRLLFPPPLLERT